MLQHGAMHTDAGVAGRKGEDHHTERVLRARGRALKSVISPLTDPVIVLDRACRVVCSTGPWGGVDAGAVLKSDFVLFASVDERERVRALLDEVTKTGERRVFELQLLPKGECDGAVYRVDAAPVRENDEILGMVLVTAEITAQRREIEQLRRSARLMVDTEGVAHLGTWEWDPSQPTARWSDELFRIYGLDMAKHVPSYEDYLTRVHPDDRERVIAATNGVFHEHQPYSHDERVFKPDGTMRYLHTWAQPILAPDGSLERLIGVCQDITDRKLVEEERDRLIAELREAVRVREVFLAVASHELATPLTSLRLNLQLWKRGLARSGEKIPLELERALGQVDRLCLLADGLLDVSRITSGRIVLDKRRLDLGGVVNAAVDRLRSRAAVQGCALEVVVEPGLIVDADRTRLDQVVTNLLTNAIKFGAGRPIRVEARRERDVALLSVRDHGIGIAPEHRDRVFGRFERAVSEMQYGGLGLGLFIAREFVTAHGGRVWFDSAVGEGATFYAELPLSANRSI